jgi:hypothetical protein
VGITALAAPPPATAQWIDTTLKPIRPTYGIPVDEFAIIGTHYKWQTNGEHDRLWQYIHSLGFHIMNQSFGTAVDQVDMLDEIMHSGFRNRDTTTLSNGFPLDRLIISSAALPSWKAGFGREIEFYPFDSVQTTHWVWRFVKRNGGATENNEVEDDPVNPLKPAREQVYQSSNTTTGDTIAWNVAYRYDASRHVHRYEQDIYDTNHSAQDASWFLEHARSTPGASEATTYYIAARGHLFPSGTAQSSDPIFRIELWHEIAKGKGYLRPNLTTAIAGQDTAILVDTFLVSKGELESSSPTIDIRRFRTIVRASDLWWRRSDGGPGPLHPSQPVGYGGSRRLDVRVFWTGAEKAALRSIALRDSIGNLLVGSTSASIAYRTSLYTQWARQVLGDGLRRDSLPRRTVIRVESGTEPNFNPTEFAGYNVVNKIFKDSFNLAPYRSLRSQSMQPGDSVTAFEWDGPAKWFHELGTQDETYTYFYINDQRDTVSLYTGAVAANKTHRAIFETPEHQIPTLPEHNGGRFHLPVLGLTADSVERYETTLQRGFIGYYESAPNPYYWPYDGIGGNVQSLGNAAAGARKYGKRYMPHVGLVQAMIVRDTTTSTDIDTIMSHRPERSEIRCFTNLSLAYGARGIWWWLLATNGALLGPSPAHPTRTITTNIDRCCVGVGGST